ncbi:hypothetical protein GWK47_023031 [Chionoecetes opilio]|uniref:Uncharacterized protein n=1 Tax=Chionoecetes opilio TaxID=41210 RepID=A0A8J4XMZ6_CHIOP|nr:hypothetical protein GWK47_023031 [Chionoecetes opilio]
MSRRIQRQEAEGTRTAKGYAVGTLRNARSMLQCVRRPLRGEQGGCPKARGGRSSAKRGGRQLCLEASLDHPTTQGHFFSLLAPEFSLTSRRTLGREIDQVSATAKSGPLLVCCMNTSYVANNGRQLDPAHKQGLHVGMSPLDRPGSPPPTWHIGVQGVKAIFDVPMSSAWGNKGGVHHTEKRAKLCRCIQLLWCGEYAVEEEEEQDHEVGLASLQTCMPLEEVDSYYDAFQSLMDVLS